MKSVSFITLTLFLLLLTACTSNKLITRPELSLGGEWKFRIDSLDIGIKGQWYKKLFTDSVKLPGSMAENGKGYEVGLNTDWTGNIVDSSYFTDKKYEKYRQPGNIKIPFWLKPVKYYKGVAWYQKDMILPPGWKGKRVVLFLERCHWGSTVFVNGYNAGSQNSLSTPHQYEISQFLVPGRNLISIRIDNRILIPVGVNSHSISDHTQTDWNGIIGDISLIATSEIFISNIQVFPDLHNKYAKVSVEVTNNTKHTVSGIINLHAESFSPGTTSRLKEQSVKMNFPVGRGEVVVDYPMGNSFRTWSEFTPSLYTLSVCLARHDGKEIDFSSADFGMREFRAEGTRFEINGHPVFLRGTVECCIFPLTGYPPEDEGSWERVLHTCKDYGLNHIRFHSWCPPEAAFRAADRLGLYFQIECGSWANQGSTIGDGSPVDQFIYDESDRIMKAYGNHPSFCMLAYGNEPDGKNMNEYLGKLINYWKSKDNRRVYTSGAGWPIIPGNDYNVSPEPRIQHWGEGLKSIINAQPPQTVFDYRDFVSKYRVPTLSHETGQWCVYPDFTEIPEYTGVLKPTNFEIFRESLDENYMGDQAKDFLMASGRLQVLCYKAEIEAALRTPGFAGFELLQLHDFPGQGTALVGILNPFFESKGYVTPQEFRMFCNETVPLARMNKMIYRSDETFEARVEIAHFGSKPLRNAEIDCQITASDGNIIRREIMKMNEIKIGDSNIAGVFAAYLNNITSARRLTFEISIAGTPFRNKWDFWVYPANQQIDKGKVLVTDKTDRNTEDFLKKGGYVLLLTYGKIRKEKGAQIDIGFSSIFWNTAWTGNQPPSTLGILCNPKDPVFKYFPTENHSNWQWWDPVTHSQVMLIDGFPSELRPLIQPIDTWFENRRLALAFESRTGGGKLLVCSIDMTENIQDRPVTKQLMLSMLKYMNSGSFDPKTEIDFKLIRDLLE